MNSAEGLAQSREEIEFLVDSGASTTVAGDEIVRAARATGPNPHANYRVADVTSIPNKGYKNFVGVTEEGFNIALTSSMIDVDRPLSVWHRLCNMGATWSSPRRVAMRETQKPRRDLPCNGNMGDCSHSICGSPERRISSELGARLFTGRPRAGRKAPTGF